jgi:preprotein translocase subunit SecA
MSNIINSFVSKIFGSKSGRDIKEITPLLDKAKIAFEQIQTISNDELRNYTTGFKAQIQNHIKSISSEIAAIKMRIESETEMEMSEKVSLYDSIDVLEKEENKLIEEVLLTILPTAFAVVKETARRFSTNEFIEVTATAMDKDLAAAKGNVEIIGDKAKHHSTWIAAGNPMKWDMVHYDVQIIGGIVLHQGNLIHPHLVTLMMDLLLILLIVLLLMKVHQLNFY